MSYKTARRPVSIGASTFTTQDSGCSGWVKIATPPSSVAQTMSPCVRSGWCARQLRRAAVEAMVDAADLWSGHDLACPY
jgi:hypothetical protein